ncbi:MAG: T9SS type A sorting domain-containing protein, partial [Bacteroidia bacterium]|nr:T9SS type A sorting domain-containing protein [Bacteroidia bacterium]
KYLVFSLVLLNSVYSMYAQTYRSFEKWMPRPTAPYSLKNTAYCESYNGENTWAVFQIDSMQGSAVKGRQQWLMRMDINGNNLWSTKLVCKNSYVNSIIPCSDDGALLTGQIPNGTYWAGWLCKVDKYGNIQWTYKYAPTTPHNFHFKKTFLYENTFYVLGHKIYSTYSLPVILKLDTLGNIIWSKEYKEYPASHYPGFIGKVKDNVITFSTAVSDNGTAYICDIDTSGKVVWNRLYKVKYPTLDALIPIDVFKLNDNSFLISAGHTYFSAFVIDTSGSVLWNNYIPHQDYNINFQPLIEENNKIYSFASPLQSIFYKDSIKQSFGVVYQNLNIGPYPDTYVYYSNNMFNHKPKNSRNMVSLIASKIYPSSNVWLKKTDTTLSDTYCPKIVKYLKDTVPLLKDSSITISNYGMSLTKTAVPGLTYPLNIQWTFECGKIAPSSIITPSTPVFNLVLYPNPAQEHITLRTELKNYELRLWDSYGRLLYKALNMSQGEYMLPVSHLPQGTYHIECVCNQQHFVQTFVKIQP